MRAGELRRDDPEFAAELFLGMLVGQGDAQEKAGSKPAAPAAVAVSAVQVEPRTVPVTFEAVGRTEGSREVQVRARIAGIVEAQLYREGDAMQMATARLRQAELNLSYTTVRAPIGGVTGRALQSVGTLVQPNSDSALLTTLTRDDPIWVRFALSEAEYAWLRASEAKGIEVRIELADGREYDEAGRLNFSGSTVDETTGTVQMRAALPNGRGELLAGQYVRVRVIAGAQEAIVVPQAAVLQDGSGRYVYVAGADGKAAVRPIRAGAWLGGDWWCSMA